MHPRTKLAPWPWAIKAFCLGRVSTTISLFCRRVLGCFWPFRKYQVGFAKARLPAKLYVHGFLVTSNVMYRNEFPERRISTDSQLVLQHSKFALLG